MPNSPTTPAIHGPGHPEASPPYGDGAPRNQPLGRMVALLALLCGVVAAGPVGAAPLPLVAFGDSLTAGYGLPEAASFPVKLEAALKARGHDVAITNAGVSGDTTAAGLERIDWSVPDGTKGVILELGANDMLRGQPPEATAKNLDAMLKQLGDRHIPVLLVGMLANPTLGPDYGKKFEAIYPDLATRYGVPLYRFFLDGVAGQRGLEQADGEHPNAAGVDVIVAKILPAVEGWLATLPAAKTP